MAQAVARLLRTVWGRPSVVVNPAGDPGPWPLVVDGQPHFPDVMSLSFDTTLYDHGTLEPEELEILLDVETSLGPEQVCRWTGHAAIASDAGAPFVVVVPSSCEPQAAELLNAHGLDARIWTYEGPDPQGAVTFRVTDRDGKQKTLHVPR